VGEEGVSGPERVDRGLIRRHRLPCCPRVGKCLLPERRSCGVHEPALLQRINWIEAHADGREMRAGSAKEHHGLLRALLGRCFAGPDREPARNAPLAA
jgi:hypothetical protein